MFVVFLIITVLCIALLFHELDKRVQEQREDELAAKRRLEEQKLFEYNTNLELEKKKKLAEEEKLRQFEQERLMNELAEPQKYMFFDTSRLHYNLSGLYRKVIKKNCWIHEPFHSKYFQFLLLLNNNEFMIVDTSSEVITMYIRDINNIPQKSEAYQVFSTKDIVDYVINHTLIDIKSLNEEDAQNSVIAIFIYALMISVHYTSKEVPQNIINELLNKYEHKQKVEEIVALIEEDDSRYVFIPDTFRRAFLSTQTLPYNNSESPKQIVLPLKLPQKHLQTI